MGFSIIRTTYVPFHAMTVWGFWWLNWLARAQHCAQVVACVMKVATSHMIPIPDAMWWMIMTYFVEKALVVIKQKKYLPKYIMGFDEVGCVHSIGQHLLIYPFV